jgi:ribosome-binding protein aMBF1 (putative translation factor)
MATVSNVFRGEIERACKQYVRSGLAQLRKADGNREKEIADIRRRLKSLESAIKALGGTPFRTSPLSEVDVSAEELATLRPTGQMVIAIRKKLGISQETLAKIMNVTAQSVYLWERKKGPLTLRTNATHSFARVRKLSRHDAQRMLHQINVIKLKK